NTPLGQRRDSESACHHGARAQSASRYRRCPLMPIPINVRQFYLDERRRTSREVTFGLEWTSDSDPDAIYGVHWIEATKEIYVLRGPMLPIFVRSINYAYGGTIPPRFADDEYEVIVLGTADSRTDIEQALEGWGDQVAKPNSLQWVREQLAKAANGL
ncbi:MAG: hypothetical protein M3010_13325, partial [Candidatus Dormibacteraeota bacterium]|nr:hypothetical protein [Candidatus Dormibacteraeota bacterium]